MGLRMNEKPRVITYLQGGTALDPDSPSVPAPDSVRIRNLAYMHARYSDYPLAPLIRGPIDGVVAFAVDMDGTSTTTEPLALHALEYMVRRFTDRMGDQEWGGLDPVRDYPNVIGHSNQYHTEFLLERYRESFKPTALRAAFLDALAWTVAHLQGTARVRQILETARICGLGGVVASEEFRHAMQVVTPGAEDAAEKRLRTCLAANAGAFRADEHGAMVRAALDVYYLRYHSILLRVRSGDATGLAAELLGDANRRLIEAMPAYAAFVAVIKGWLGAEVRALCEELRAGWGDAPDAAPDDVEARTDSLVASAVRFEREPAKLALVTASIGIEAHIVMDEVRVRMAHTVRDWSISEARKERILRNLEDREMVFDAFVTADDACEHRLKPHPDLFSLALHRMAIEPRDFARCVGVEDTEAGVVSLRAAGVGCAVALPNGDTRRQDFRAAAHILAGGLPDLLARHHALMQPLGAEATKRR